MLGRLPLLYCVWGILTGLALAWVMPPWQNPDEAAHVERAVQISLGHLLGQRLANGAGGLTDPAVNASAAPLAGLAFHPWVKVTPAMLTEAARPRWGRPGIEGFDNTANYAPFLYVVAVPALWAGRAGRMTVTATLRLVRMADAIAAALLGAAALAAARRTRLAIAAVLLLPMSVALAASASQDAVLIPLAALAVALIDRARSGQAAGRAMQAGIATILMLVILARPPILPLASLLLLLPGRRRLALGLALGVCAATVLWSAYVARYIAPPMNGADPARTAAALLNHPLAFARVLGATFDRYGDFYLASMVGVLGWLDTWLPPRFVTLAAWGLALALLSAAVPEAQPDRWRRVVLGWGAALGAALGVFLSIYLVWTPLGTPTVEGIQGRYFLPLLPALALGMPSLGRWAAALRPAALLAVLLLAAATPAITLSAVVGRYYLAS